MNKETKRPETPPSGNSRLAKSATWIAIFVALGAGYGKWHLSARWKDVARSVKQGDIVMYSSDGCEPANRAREHFRKYKIEFTECDIKNDEQCYRRFELLKTDRVPTFVVYGKRVIKGFGASELYEALRKNK